MGPAGDWSSICVGTSSPTGAGGIGATCQDGSGCRSGRCSPMLHKCTDVCCVDDDCKSAGWVCRPADNGSGFAFLTCVPPTVP
jgi:hypothetical protein